MKTLVLIIVLSFAFGCAVQGPFERGKQVKLEDVPLKPTPEEGEEGECESVDCEPEVSPESFYNEHIAPLIESDCMMCHPGKITSYEDAKQRIVPGDPDNSVFLTKAVGERHRSIWNPEGEEALKVIEWIQLESN